MSAMHWEARRRQSALDRRMTRDRQQLYQTSSETSSETSSNASKSSEPSEQTAGDQCPTCKGNLKTPIHHGAKLPNRFSSLQYSQQL